jgi:hypothetical protein
VVATFGFKLHRRTLQRSLAFWREVGATPYVRDDEALLAASA